jgi:hypothetical protein
MREKYLLSKTLFCGRIEVILYIFIFIEFNNTLELSNYEFQSTMPKQVY